MRCVAAAAAFAASFLCSSAQAEQRMFIIANDANDYGVDRCLVSNAATVAVACGNSCGGDHCGEFVAIECSR
jgi:hypothetical protein